MPIVISPNKLYAKKQDGSGYLPANVISVETTETQLARITAEGNTQYNAVNTAGTTQVAVVNTAGTTQVAAVNTAGTTQVAAVNTEGTTQVSAVNTAGATQVATITAKGEEYINSIQDIGDIKSALTESDIVELYDFIQDYYIDTQGSTADITNPTSSSSGYRYTVADCEPSDIFVVTGYGGNGPRLWCFIDGNGNTLTPKAVGNEKDESKVIVAPSNAQKLIVNSRTDCSLIKVKWNLETAFSKAYQAKGIFPANANYNDYKTIGVYRKYGDNNYPVINGPDWIPTTETQLLIVLRGNTSGSDTAIFQIVVTYSHGFAKRHCASGNWSQWEKIDDVIKQKPVLCVSTFRDGAYVSEGTQPYFLALSYDGGKSFFEIKESQSFAGANLSSTDVQPFEWNDGVIFICTAGGSSSIYWDFKVVYTRDFNTYYDLKPDLGFMRKGAEYTNSPYVWGPQIFKKGNDYYIVASVSIGDNEEGDLYNPAPSSSLTRYEYPFARKVTFTFDETNGFNIVPDGEIFQLQFENETESIQDISLLYSSSVGKVFIAYKDRILNTINIASASDITGTFEDEETFIGNMAYSEACYFTTISRMSYLYWCTYGLRTSAKRRFFTYNANKVFDTSETTEYVGVVNSNRFDNGSPIDMRNPYPIELSTTMFNRLAAKYNLPVTIPTYQRAEKQEYKESAILTRMSHHIYDKLGKFVRIPDKYLVPISAKTDKDEHGDPTGDMCDMCFENPEYTAKIGGIAGTTTIRFPSDRNQNAVTVTKSAANAEMYKIGYGYIYKGAKSISE